MAEALLSETVAQSFEVSADELASLFMLDSIKDYQTKKLDLKVSKSLYKLEEELQGIKGLTYQLNTDVRRGISLDDMSKRIKTYGTNREKKRKSKGLCTLIIEPFDDRMM